MQPVAQCYQKLWGMPGTSIDFPEGRIKWTDGIFKSTLLRGTMKGKDYRSLEEMVSIVAVFIDRSTE